MSIRIADLAGSTRGLYVVAEEQKTIAGHLLLDPQTLASVARVSKRVRKIELRVREGNHRAIRLYEKLGYTVEGRFKQRIRIGENYIDDIAMGLIVADQKERPTDAKT